MAGKSKAHIARLAGIPFLDPKILARAVQEAALEILAIGGAKGDSMLMRRIEQQLDRKISPEFFEAQMRSLRRKRYVMSISRRHEIA